MSEQVCALGRLRPAGHPRQFCLLSSPRLTQIIFPYSPNAYLHLLKFTIMIGQLNTDDIETLLRRSVLGRIGYGDGKRIYIVPISYIYDGGYIYCYTHEGLKTAILRKNTSVCFEVEQLENLANWQTVVAHGDFEELTDPLLRLDALQKLNARRLPFITSQTTRLTDEWPFASETLDKLPGVTFRIRLTGKTGRFEKATQLAEVFF
jgi:nitroimidazol reductase NimA-like FMN-containing flavoprotein (pyridoxamine 5'-phosphate oxidase superfamily)